MSTLASTYSDDNESMSLTIETTAGACGLDPSTDGSAGDEQPIRLIVTASIYEGRTRTQVSALTPGLTLRAALSGAAPSYLEFDADIVAALDRLMPGWLNGALEAEAQLETEEEASWGTDGERNAATADAEDRWLEALEGRTIPTAWVAAGVRS